MSLKSYQSFKNPVNFSFWRISMKFLHNVVLYKHSLKNIFWQFSYPYGYLIYEVTTYYYGRTIQLQILLMVFKCYIWGLPWKYYGISISFQSQKWIRLVIKRLLPNNLWYWWLYQSSKVKNCDISKWQKCDLDRSSPEVFIYYIIYVTQYIHKQVWWNVFQIMGYAPLYLKSIKCFQCIQYRFLSMFAYSMVFKMEFTMFFVL